MKLYHLIFILFLLNLTSINGQSIRLVTWNIQDMGRTKDEDEIHQMARILKDADVVAIQEVVARDPAGAQAVAQLADELNRMGAKWDYRISDPTTDPSPGKRERYAFLWKTSALTMLGSPFLDQELAEICVREPFIGRFRINASKKEFHLVNFHSRVFSEQPQIEITYFQLYPKRLSTDAVIIAGDFNSSEDHPVFNTLYKIGFKAALQNTGTTLKRTCTGSNYQSHAIDNIYYPASVFRLMSSGVLDFVGDCDNLEYARQISDHLPVFGELQVSIK